MILLEKYKERCSIARNKLSGQIILKRIFKLEWEEVKWIVFSQNGDSGFAFVNMVMNICFHKRGREFFEYMRK